jgi:hypothetical protein
MERMVVVQLRHVVVAVREGAMKVRKLIHGIMFIFWLLIGGVSVYIQIIDKNYMAALLLTLLSSVMIMGHLRIDAWAAQASTFILVLFNLFAIFLCFPPYGSEELSYSFAARIVILVSISVLCIGLSIGLYLAQKASKEIS